MKAASSLPTCIRTAGGQYKINPLVPVADAVRAFRHDGRSQRTDSMDDRYHRLEMVLSV
jgi:hypothetical protein